MTRRSWCCVLVGAAVFGCGKPAPPPSAAARTAPSLPGPPVVTCADHPEDRQVVVTCRYFHEAHADVVWRRSLEQASAVAVSRGFSHVQWLGLEKRSDVMRDVPPPIDGQPLQPPVVYTIATRFSLLNEDEAAARSADSSIPPERRPVDARVVNASTTAPRGEPTPGPRPDRARPPAPRATGTPPIPGVPGAGST